MLYKGRETLNRFLRSTGYSLNLESFFPHNKFNCFSSERKLSRDTLFMDIQILEILGLIPAVLCREM